MLYLKPGVRGDEGAADIVAYARAHREFPNQSTGDQWFDEPQLDGRVDTVVGCSLEVRRVLG